MTNLENVKMQDEVNKAYAVLIKAAYAIDSQYQVEKLHEQRHFFCNQIDAYYYANKTSGVSK